VPDWSWFGTLVHPGTRAAFEQSARTRNVLARSRLASLDAILVQAPDGGVEETAQPLRSHNSHHRQLLLPSTPLPDYFPPAASVIDPVLPSRSSHGLQ